MGGKKRQETSSSSSLRSLSGRRDSVSPAPAAGNQTEHHAKAVNVGCMSGVFHLVSKYHTRRKFLAFGKRQEVKALPPAKPKTTTTTITSRSPPHEDKYSSETTGRTSLEKPRSPLIPAEIRSSGSANSPKVVARLMGIEDIPASPPAAGVVAESATEKRRRLLGALEKCDEDLKALKKIIDAVRASHTPPRAAEKVAGGGGGMREKGVEEEEDREEEEEREDEPSPVSVLDFHQRSPPLTAHSKRTRYGQVLHQHHIQKQQKQKPVRKTKPGDEYSSSFCFLNKSTAPSSVVNISTLTSVFHPTKARPPLIDTARRLTTAAILPWSEAVVESVEEVCRDVEWGQTSEVGVIGLLIQDFIFKDLVEEITKEMMLMMKNKRSGCFDYVFGSSRIVGLPDEACKRKLRL
ncbi:hypothetical protein Cgig2_001380 [Carnegiea gigantea]|uniref:DUF3741 domain-containing protein n=1 Tax=Carnegiea gigantea TaxID=171969 RepID=A0A9Q1KVM3_9CARY|nr:hypothetical protein Cgig2_001380 [Carnegiea gigantea]